MHKEALLKTVRSSSLRSIFNVKYHEKGKRFLAGKWQQTHECAQGPLWAPDLERVTNTTAFYYLKYKLFLRI